NVDAEKTAWLCWKRIRELAEGHPDLPPTLLQDFDRIRDDEDRHCQIFQILADSLTAEDRLTEGVTPERLARQFGAVGEFFLPRALRGETVADNPLGGGGTVWVKRGTTPEEKRPLFRQLLADAGLPGLIEERCRKLGKTAGELRVAIKAPFMLGVHRKDRAHI